MFSKIWRSLLFATTLCGTTICTYEADSSALPLSVDKISNIANEVADDLINQVLFCVARKDTDHPAFYGCVDWHSAVHGTWALIAYMNATQNQRFDGLIRNNILSDSSIKAEHAYLTSHPSFEMPYGRAWFLRLAIDYEKRYGDKRLESMADMVGNSILAFYANKNPQPLARDYASASWALTNLLDYANFRKNQKLENEVNNMILTNFVSENDECPENMSTGGFMAVCESWAAAVSRVMPRDKFLIWVERLFKRSGFPIPIRNPASAHENGLNFSRAWNYWALYDATGDVRFADAFASHFKNSYERKDSWAGDYRRVGHWVAQFGMYALQPLFGKELGR